MGSEVAVSSGGGSSRRSPVPTAEGPFVYTLSPSKSPHTTGEVVESAARDLRRTYHRRVLDVLIRSVRGALDSIRRHTSVTSPRGKGDATGRGHGPVHAESQGVALVELSASLVSPGVQVTPSLMEVQEAISKVAKIILSTAKGVSQWVRCRKEDVSIWWWVSLQRTGEQLISLGWKIRGDTKGARHAQELLYMSESKDVSKIMSQMVNSFQTVDRTLRSYVLLDRQIKSEPTCYRVGALAINTDQLKKALVMEAGLWVEKYGEALKTTYLKEMERLFAQLSSSLSDFVYKDKAPIIREKFSNVGCSAAAKSKAWDKITSLLAVKECQKWWQTVQSAAKANRAEFNEAQHGAGGSPPSKPIDNIDKMVLDILGEDSIAVTGFDEVVEIFLPNENEGAECG
ncbi:hypothetical protein O3P69_014129 [Scylla paramamosain]|uniref:Uncharacterized protein n=1 Tax=Scylla paramamosain TaxID=85552 RepID=A0AAW0SAI3_SCYPA